MKLKRHYFIILLLVVAAVTASVLLMPRQQEIALMNMKDKHFEAAQKAYEQQLRNGNISIDTAKDLSDLYLQAGAVNKAVEIMEKFVSEHPDHVEALMRLGRLYQYAQRQDDYLKILEAINRLHTDPETLKQLSQIYNATNQPEKEADTLKQLVDLEQGKDAAHVLDLANILTSTHAYRDAVNALNMLHQEHPDQFSIKEERLLVSLLLDDKQTDAAFSEALAWVTAKHDVGDTAQLLDVLAYKGNAALADKLLSHVTDDQLNSNPALLEQYVHIKVATGDNDAVYQRLSTLYTNHALSQKLDSALILLAATHRDLKTAQSLLGSIDAKALSESQWLTLVEIAQDEHDTALLNALAQVADKPGMHDAYPMLAAVLHSGTDTLDKLDTAGMTSMQALQVARICAYMKKTACSNRFLESITNVDGLSDADIADIGMIYWQTKQWDKGYAFLARFIKTRNAPEIAAVMARFVAARGDDMLLMAWLHEQPDADQHLLEDLYFAAAANQHWSTAVIVAEYLQRKDDSPQSRSLLADAYMKTGQYEPAVALLRQNAYASEPDLQNYLLALKKLATNHPAYGKEFDTAVTRRLHSDIPESQKITLIYALLNSHQNAAAMPYVRDLAEHKGGHWAAYYAAELDKLGKHDEARHFWLKVAYAPSTAAAEKSAIAYTLLNNGYKADAEAIFMDLAVNATPDSDEMNALLYAWGPHPDAVQMQWLETRYTSASPQEKAGWEKLISGHMTDDEMIASMDAHPQWLEQPVFATRYVLALINNGQFKVKADDIINRLAKSGNSTLLVDCGRLARQNGFKREARKAFEAAIIIDPNNNAALREAGLVAFEQADYKAAQMDLGAYISSMHATDKQATDYQPLFVYAELLRRNHRLEDAKEYYSTVVDLIDGSADHTPEAWSAKSESLIWLGRGDEGLKSFDAARAEYPNNEILRADLISTMLELRAYDEAQALLATPPHSTFEDISLVEHLSLDPHDVRQSTLLDGNRKLLVHFSHAITDSGDLSPQRLAHIPWISYANEGYDTLLIVAKQGYTFALDDAPAHSFGAVVDTSSSVAELNRQIVLRYNLLAARAELETGYVYAASQRLSKLLPQYADDSQLLGFAANAENYGGNWPLAEQLLNKAHALAPENTDITRLQHDVRLLHEDNVTLGHDWVRLGKAQEQITTLSTIMTLNDSVQVGGTLQNNDMRVSTIRKSNGVVGKFDGNRERGELFAERYGDNGERIKLSVFANNDTPGVGANYTFLNTLGQTTFTGEWHRPYWDLAEAVADETTRDRLAFEHVIKPSPRMIISGGMGLNRYNDSVLDNALSSVSGKFSIAYTLMDELPFISVGYGVDAEYLLNHKKNMDSTGDYTSVLPLYSREVHFVSLNAGYAFDDVTYGQFMLGYGFDRFGGHGPTVSGELTRALSDRLDLQLHALYGMDNSNSKNTSSQLGADIRWRLEHDNP